MTEKVLIGILSAAVIVVGVFVVKDLTFQKKQITSEVTQSASDTAPTAKSSAKVAIEDIVEGTGPEVKSGDTVVINYKGTLEDGTQFDSSYDRGEPYTTRIGVGEVIAGWDQGVPGMKVGGKRKLTIPSELGYGESGNGDIPPNATLIFEVELVSIQ